MQTFVEFLPWIIFGLVYWQGGGLYPATGALMVAMALLIAYDWITTRKVPRMHLWLAIMVWVFGAATLLLQDVRFLQWKATAFYWVGGLLFTGSAFIGEQPLLQRLLGKAIPEGTTVPPATWRKSSVLMGISYFAFGAANIWVALNRSEAEWVRFKVVILPIAAVVVTFGIIFWLMRGLDAREDSQ